MATAENEQKISIKIVVDKKKNKVIFAESDRYFVDILLSFLTMPLGTIARLVGTQQESQAIGSLTSLYRGVAGLDDRYLSTEACKDMLLYPRNSADFLCKKLKLNIYDPEPAKYFKGNDSCKHLSTLQGTSCSCGYLLYNEVCVIDSGIYLNVAMNDEVFVNSHTLLFIITDDLRITPASNKYVFELLKGLQDTELNWTVLNIGLQEVLLVLQMSLLTNSALTHAFLSDQSKKISKPMQLFGTKKNSAAHVNNENGSSSICSEIKLKLVWKKNDLRVLYAVAGEDFVDLLFSFLAYPLGTVEKLFDGHLKHSNIDNLYNSVKDLDVHKLIASNALKTMLLDPKVATKFLGRNQLLQVDEASGTRYLHKSDLRKGGVHEYYLTLTRHTCDGFQSEECTIIDPKSTYGSTSSLKGYVKGPSTFMILDDLKVSPFSAYDAVKLIRESNVDVKDVEELVIKVRRDEALSILNASLVSASALSLVFNSKLRKLKSQESCSCRPKDFVLEF